MSYYPETDGHIGVYQVPSLKIHDIIFQNTR